MEEPTPDDDVTVAPLAGFTVGITAARRAEELRTMLERRGAAVLHGPALRLVPLADDVELRAATEDLIARPPHVTFDLQVSPGNRFAIIGWSVLRTSTMVSLSATIALKPSIT